MTQRLVRIATVATAFVLGAAASRLPFAGRGRASPATAGVERTLCEMRCEQRHHACVLLAAIINTANFDDSIGRPRRGPRNERPGKWPFTDDIVVDDPRAEPAKDPKCSFLQDRCFANECGVQEGDQSKRREHEAPGVERQSDSGVRPISATASYCGTASRSACC